jgi:benzoate membrane transport protein
MNNNNSILQGLKDLPKHLNSKTISSGIIAGIFGWCTALILFANGNACGWTVQETSSWIFACWVFGPVLGIILSLKFKEPIPGAWSISGAAVVVSGAGAGYSLQQLCTGFLLAGILVFILGITGLISKVMKYLPMPIVMGMTAGCLFKFVTNMVTFIYNWSSEISKPNYGKYLLIAGFAIVAWLVFTKLKPVIKIIPPILAALAVVIICVFAFGLYDASALHGIQFYGPKFIGYSFENVGGVFVSVSIPLALLVIGAENAQAMGVLKSQDYEPPVKSMTIWSGIGGIVTSMFGGHNANIAGPMTAIVASDESGEDKEGRYAAAVVCGVWCSIIGIFASLLVPFLGTMPLKLIYLVAGLAMVGVILSSLQAAFKGNEFQVSAFFAFFVALSQKSFFGIGSAFWALLIGIIVAAVLETKDLKRIINEVN